MDIHTQSTIHQTSQVLSDNTEEMMRHHLRTECVVTGVMWLGKQKYVTEPLLVF
jgi:hypothetical protein